MEPITSMTPAERAAKMNAYPTHVIYMTRAGQSHALITQSYCKVLAATPESMTLESVSGVVTIPRDDVFAVKEGRLTPDEREAVFAEHAHKQWSLG